MGNTKAPKQPKTSDSKNITSGKSGQSQPHNAGPSLLAPNTKRAGQFLAPPATNQIKGEISHPKVNSTQPKQSIGAPQTAAIKGFDTTSMKDMSRLHSLMRWAPALSDGKRPFRVHHAAMMVEHATHGEHTVSLKNLDTEAYEEWKKDRMNSPILQAIDKDIRVACEQKTPKKLALEFYQTYWQTAEKQKKYGLYYA